MSFVSTTLPFPTLKQTQHLQCTEEHCSETGLITVDKLTFDPYESWGKTLLCLPPSGKRVQVCSSNFLYSWNSGPGLKHCCISIDSRIHVYWYAYQNSKYEITLMVGGHVANDQLSTANSIYQRATRNFTKLGFWVNHWFGKLTNRKLYFVYLCTKLKQTFRHYNLHKERLWVFNVLLTLTMCKAAPWQPPGTPYLLNSHLIWVGGLTTLALCVSVHRSATSLDGVGQLNFTVTISLWSVY